MDKLKTLCDYCQILKFQKSSHVRNAKIKYLKLKDSM